MAHGNPPEDTAADPLPRSPDSHYVEIISDGPSRTTQVKINGRVVPRVRAYTLRQDVGDLPVLSLDIVVTELYVQLHHATVEAQPAALPRVIDETSDETAT